MKTLKKCFSPVSPIKRQGCKTVVGEPTNKCFGRKVTMSFGNSQTIIQQCVKYTAPDTNIILKSQGQTKDNINHIVKFLRKKYIKNYKLKIHF